MPARVLLDGHSQGFIPEEVRVAARHHFDSPPFEDANTHEPPADLLRCECVGGIRPHIFWFGYRNVLW
jgi:hypothetical protein